MKVVVMTGRILLPAKVSQKTFREVYCAECVQIWQLPCVRTNVLDHWGTVHQNSHVGAISGHVTRPYRERGSNRGSNKHLISEIQALIFPRNPARPQEIKATVMDGLGLLAKEGRGFSARPSIWNPST